MSSLRQPAAAAYACIHSWCLCRSIGTNVLKYKYTRFYWHFLYPILALIPSAGNSILGIEYAARTVLVLRIGTVSVSTEMQVLELNTGVE